VARLFVAVWPPASFVPRLRELPRPARPGLRWTTEDQWHVTLRFLGQVGEIGIVPGVLAEAAALTPPVEARAGPSPHALGRGVWVLPVEGLQALAGRVAAATREIGQPPPDRSFRGHLTLARARRPAALSGLAELVPGELSARWRVTEITLVQSDLRPDGARYEVLARWPLQGGDG
jgi:2'-5' RNA ligase